MTCLALSVYGLILSDAVSHAPIVSSTLVVSINGWKSVKKKGEKTVRILGRLAEVSSHVILMKVPAPAVLQRRQHDLTFLRSGYDSIVGCQYITKEGLSLVFVYDGYA